MKERNDTLPVPWLGHGRKRRATPRPLHEVLPPGESKTRIPEPTDAELAAWFERLRLCGACGYARIEAMLNARQGCETCRARIQAAGRRPTPTLGILAVNVKQIDQLASQGITPGTIGVGRPYGRLDPAIHEIPQRQSPKRASR